MPDAPRGAKTHSAVFKGQYLGHPVKYFGRPLGAFARYRGVHRTAGTAAPCASGDRACPLGSLVCFDLIF